MQCVIFIGNFSSLIPVNHYEDTHTNIRNKHSPVWNSKVAQQTMSTMWHIWPRMTRYTTHIHHAHGVVLLCHLLGILYDGFQVGQPISDLWGGGINGSETCTALWQRGRAKDSLLPGYDIVAPWAQHTSLLEAPQLHTSSNMGSSALHTPHVTWDPNSGASWGPAKYGSE